MERNADLEKEIERAITRLEFAKNNLYIDPRHTLKMISAVEDNMQSIYIKLAKLIGIKMKS